MDALVSKHSLDRRHVVLGVDGARFRSEIEAEVADIPNKRVWGRRHGDRKCIDVTLDLIQRLYAGETPREDNTPAVEHILRVAHRIAVEWKIKDPNVIMAALLHDAVEDHPEVLARRGKRKHHGKDDHADAISFVQKHYGGKVSRIVDRVSKRKSPEGLDPEAKIPIYVSYVQSISRDPAALVVKIADVCDNIQNPRPIAQGGFYSMRKYALALPVLETGFLKNEAFVRKHCGDAAFEAIRASVEHAKTLASGFLLGAPIES